MTRFLRLSLRFVLNWARAVPLQKLFRANNKAVFIARQNI
jgi:hypothetical protein